MDDDEEETSHVRRIPLASGSGGADPGRARFALLATAVALLGLAGYIGYVAYPRFDLPAVAGTGLLVLAAGAGVASFFSPCSFPLLLTLLARHVHGGSRTARARSALVFAATFSAGAASFLVLLGALVGLGGRGLASAVTFTSPTGVAIRITVGVVLVLLGLIQREVLPVSFHGVERATRPLTVLLARHRRTRPVAGSALFGFSYLLVAFG